MTIDFQDYTIQDFVWDEDFRHWVLNPDADSDFYWKQWLARNSDRRADIENAIDIVKALKTDESGLSHEDEDAYIGEIFARINDKRSRQYKNVRIKPLVWWSAAACLFIAALLAGFLLFTPSSKMAGVNGKSGLVKISNDSDSSKLVALNDGSKISLDKNAFIEVSPSLEKEKDRKVFLHGNAFFDVAKNEAKPFFVYADDITIRVVGTSFKVQSDKKQGKLSVGVISGIVKVSSVVEKGNIKRVDEVILTRNQQVEVGKDKTLKVGIVDNPVLSENEFINFAYDNVPVYKIFSDFEKGYGVKIQYDSNTIINKTFSGNLEGKTLLEKLNVVCKTLNYHFDINNGRIEISM